MRAPILKCAPSAAHPIVRDELEDLSFRELNPEARNLIVDKLSNNKLDRENVFKILEKDAEVIQQLAKENVTEVKVEQDVIESSEWILGYDQYNSNHSEKLFNLKLHIIEQSVDKMDKDDLEMIREAESPLELFSIIHQIKITFLKFLEIKIR